MTAPAREPGEAAERNVLLCVEAAEHWAQWAESALDPQTPKSELPAYRSLAAKIPMLAQAVLTLQARLAETVELDQYEAERLYDALVLTRADGYLDDGDWHAQIGQKLAERFDLRWGDRRSGSRDREPLTFGRLAEVEAERDAVKALFHSSVKEIADDAFHRAVARAEAAEERVQELEGHIEAARRELGRASDVRANRTGIIGNTDLILQGRAPEPSQ